jgi:outer membrane protein TolC
MSTPLNPTIKSYNTHPKLIAMHRSSIRKTLPAALFIIFVSVTGRTSAQRQPRQKTDTVPRQKTDTVARPKTDTPPVTTTVTKKPAPVSHILPDSVIEERLVNLAMTGPVYKQAQHQEKIATGQLSKARKSWLNLLSVSANYNDQTFAKQTNVPGAYVYPKYFFGLTIPLGLIFNIGPEVKIAKENLAASRDNEEQVRRTVRADILTKYQQFKTYDTLLIIENDAAIDEQAVLTQLENKVHSGNASIEQYNAAHKTYGEELSKGLNLKLQRDLMKIEIERIIGTRLEDVLK